MVLEKVKIYLDGTMLRIESDDPDFKNRSLPTGRMEAIEQGAGYTFVDGYHDTLLCSVDSFDDVLDAAGAVYGASQAAVTTALNAFLNFKQGGGGGALTYVKSLEQDFYFQRVLNIAGQSGDSFIGQPLNIFENVTIEGATIEITTAGTGVALVGIYDLDDNGVINNLLAVTASEYDGTVTGLQTINFASPLNLSAGSYATVFTRDNVGLSPIFRVNNVINPPFGVNGTTTYTRYTGIRAYDGTLPATAPTGLAYLGGAVPRITFSLI